MADKIQVKRGLKANLPTLSVGEPAYCTDTKEFFVGTANGNVLINDLSQLTGKVDKVAGKGLSTNDYDSVEKAEVAKVKDKADKTYVDTELGKKATQSALDATNANVAANTSALAKKVSQVNGVSPDANGNVNIGSANQRPRIIEKPTDFDWTIPFVAYKNPDGTFSTSFNYKNYLPKKTNPKIYYVDINKGSDTNDGLTQQTSFKTLKKALGMADVDIVYVAEGAYDRTDGMGSVATPARDVQIIALPGHNVIVGSFEHFSRLTWTLYSGTVYKTTRTGVLNVYDSKFIDGYGDFTKYNQKTTLEEVLVEVGSWFNDGSGGVYVNCSDGRSPDADIYLTLSFYNVNISQPYTYYFEGIKFYFAKPNLIAGVTTANRATIIARNCEFKYSVAGNGDISITGNVLTVFENCVTARAYRDGFNYHGSGAYNPIGIEINCTGRHNGLLDTANTNNGSTLHENARIIRLNGKYFNNKGSNAHDINTSQSWNVNCFMDKSVSTDPLVNCDIRVSDTAKMWLDNCYAYGESNRNVFREGVGGFIYTKECDLSKVDGVLFNY